MSNFDGYGLEEDTTTPCNCPLMECSVHAHTLCTNTAILVKHTHADGTTHEHHLGDQTMADGIHLCRACGEALALFLVDDVVTFMSEFSQYVPPWMRPLERICREYYKAQASDIGWVLPYNDALSVLTFAYACVKLRPDIPEPLLEKLVNVKKRLNQIVDAYEMKDKEIHAHE